MGLRGACRRSVVKKKIIKKKKEGKQSIIGAWVEDGKIFSEGEGGCGMEYGWLALITKYKPLPERA
jgi:hypothetical protein